MNNEQIIQQMKERVFKANLQLPNEGLIKLTWGNVSEINRDLGIIVIKPSGVSYDTMQVKDMVVTDLQGNLLEPDSLRPSSDLPTHVVLYRDFPAIGAIVHTHSVHAVQWAQAKRAIPAYGTTHADTFYGNVPCTRDLTEEEITKRYEEATGEVIVETFREKALDPLACPAVLVSGHGPFTWGENVTKAVQNSVVLDEVAKMATVTEQLSPKVTRIDQFLLDKHYYRKHGENAYYGQN
ncbi:L-ribulose-5-phosphate 4-epimerase [Enterococcus columbae]|uniref:L-ribulose-5-phosphate 4-epimerase n=1 Tax=Enterococcus columbae DSM 7374 = ATCC 51263 TaxID=1121865 RepID=S1MUF0_9ENTE|nr:L-ribulose-5-phosphate 4-epimerase [Enterococcus columbae]EOT40539.1 L-ribulose-5-phosphate 4-epimerase [Enterococcus columbae DSM 7374 = ATCC 51263]EOW80315.1 L-ribulose-5-phosphate 4-epimerase [Enterococcus columbae DSM 7374 = ATCC 51263]